VITESAIAFFTKQVEELSAQLSTIEGTVSECEAMKQEKAEWELLERALYGVRDLELDALAPSIADTATKLLAESGDPGSFEIKTTRISGKGAKAKQIEDFLIYYTYDGVSQEIGTCSGGEMVWVRKAIYDAFAIIRAKNARVRFNTVFLDETDGALFPAARMNYYRMLKVAHETLNRYQTILVTQSSEVAAMAERVIDVRELDTRRTA
jgi:exonuclease SbcC